MNWTSFALVALLSLPALILAALAIDEWRRERRRRRRGGLVVLGRRVR